MALEFVRDAISLSGLTGSKLKCAVIGDYYPFWWGITSGGPTNNHKFSTAIVELDAATGEVYIKDTKETIMGSAGHALDLKCNNRPGTSKLKVILVEKDTDCYTHLKSVIRRRWSEIDITNSEGPLSLNSNNTYLMNLTLDDALNKIEKIDLGNSLFFFDPLRSVEYDTIERVARKRLNSFYKTGTEFIIFIFTSDWFLGRDDFSALPTTQNEKEWSTEESKTVAEANALFGNIDWRTNILNRNPIQERQNNLINTYKDRLHRWFRYILPLPFNPKGEQLFHIILCSNFATGVRATRNFYSNKTGNPKYSPDNKNAYEKFKTQNPKVFLGYSGTKKPPHWRILWKTIKEHEEGICDCMCSDFFEFEENLQNRQNILNWLEGRGYLYIIQNKNAWNPNIPQYKLNWIFIRDKLGIEPPPPLKPLSPNEVVNDKKSTEIS
jgi:three-Cys-motif partner protein